MNGEGPGTGFISQQKRVLKWLLPTLGNLWQDREFTLLSDRTVQAIHGEGEGAKQIICPETT